MVPAIALFFIAGAVGWQRAARRQGTTADKLQYAMAHGIPGFLIGLAGTIIAARLGWLG